MRAEALELLQVIRPPGKEGLLVHDLFALLLAPEPSHQYEVGLYSFYQMKLTVKGRTLIATLIEEAPSETAILSRTQVIFSDQCLQIFVAIHW